MNNTTTTPVNVIDAVNDAVGGPGGAVGQTANVGTNDQVPPGSTFSILPGSTCVAPSVSAAGVATYNVPAAGSCTVNYQVCAPAPNATQCDTATLTVTAGGTDMSVGIAGLPTTAPPGAVLSATMTCTNAGAVTATNATCVASAGVPVGATVTTGACVASSGSAAALPAGATLSCPITVTMPGTAGGADTPETSVGVLGTTNATNDTNAANNTPNQPLSVDEYDDAYQAPHTEAADDHARCVPTGIPIHRQEDRTGPHDSGLAGEANRVCVSVRVEDLLAIEEDLRSLALQLGTFSIGRQVAAFAGRLRKARTR